ncbi:MAG: hypothetical protein U0736_04945 [Gemmataceae bacterium]
MARQLEALQTEAQAARTSRRWSSASGTASSPPAGPTSSGGRGNAQVGSLVQRMPGQGMTPEEIVARLTR